MEERAPEASFWDPNPFVLGHPLLPQGQKKALVLCGWGQMSGQGPAFLSLHR